MSEMPIWGPHKNRWSVSLNPRSVYVCSHCTFNFFEKTHVAYETVGHAKYSLSLPIYECV